jgi:mRNA-degrading endonuclease RelE of RelBE toxin-antitoxin system
MSFNIVVTPPFEKELKRLAKKHLSLKNDLRLLAVSLKQNPEQGTPLGEDCYKIRLAISSKNRGKLGGARIITHVKVVNEAIYLISIYDKSETTTISDAELISRLKKI